MTHAGNAHFDARTGNRAAGVSPRISEGSMQILRLAAYCSRCGRWTTLDLGRMISAGHDERRLPIVVKCHICGEPGQLQVRPPMPTWTNQNGWMQP
jgi:hypothetical protein